MKKKDQWVIHNISTGESRSFDIRTPKDRLRLFAGHTKRSYKRQLFYFYTIRFTRAFKKFKKLFASNKRTKHTIVEIPQLRWLFSNVAKGGLTVLISVLVIYGVVQAANDKLTPPTGTPVATFYSLSEIANLITANITATEGNPALDWSTALENTASTTAEIYNALASLIDPTKVLTGTTYLGTPGSMANNGAFSLTASSTAQTVAVGYYSGGTLPAASSTDTDLIADNIRNNIDIFGVIGNMVAGWLYGDSSNPAQVLTTAGTAGNGAGGGTFNVTNLSNSVIKKGTTWGASLGSTGTYSGYPGSGGGLAGLTQANCTGDWYWFEDGNGDGDAANPNDPEDGICVQQTPVPYSATYNSWNGAEQMAVASSLINQTATGGSINTITLTGAFGTTNYANMVVRYPTNTGGAIPPTCWGVVKENTADTITVYGSWLTTAYGACAEVNYPGNGTTFDVRTDGFALYDNSWIGDWTCAASGALGGTPSWGSFPTTAQVGSNQIALAVTDCYDGVRDLLPNETDRAVKIGTISATSTNSITTNLTLNVNEWVGQKVLITGGTGANGYGRIESNTSGANAVITVSGWTNGEPSTDSTFAIIYVIPHATYNPNTDVDGNDDDQLNGNNGPLTQEVLKNWQGTKLPTANDFFGFCGYNSTDGSGDGSYENTTGTYTADKTYGNYGGQVGRTDEFLDLANSGSWEWLSEQHNYNYARIAGYYACSYFNHYSVYYGYRFRAVFRP